MELEKDDFFIGALVELHPATDAWMQGDTMGVVRKIGSKYIHLDMLKSGRRLCFSFYNVAKILGDY